MPRIFLAARVVLSAALVSAAGSAAAESCNPPVPPTGSGGAWFERYQAWCARCGGRPSADASPARCTPGPDWGRASGGGGVYGGGSGAELGRQIGGVLGEMLRQGLFGNPQQEAQQQAAREAQRQAEEQERQRLANERARQDEDRYRRLSASLLDFKPAPQLSLMGSQPGGGLQLMVGEEAERSMNPALAELARAAAWSTLAARAPTAEDAVLLADAAFQSLIGGKVNLPPPPPDVKGVPVGPWLTEVEALKKPYLAQRAQLPAAVRPVMEAEQRRSMFMRLESQARAFEIHWYEGVRKPPRGASKQDLQQAEAELRRAREAARQAQELRAQAEAEAQRARDELQRRQYEVNGMEQGLRAWLSSFAAGERKPDGYYYLGFEDGSQCFSQNAGPRCDKARAPAKDYENCLASYRLGYRAGEKIKKALLEDAHRMGDLDRHAVPPRSYEDIETRADGPCRAEYIMSYNNGRFGARLSRVGR